MAILLVQCPHCENTCKEFGEFRQAGKLDLECEYCFEPFQFELKYFQMYRTFFEIGEGEQYPCEYCESRPYGEVHHIDHKGMGGTGKEANETIEELMGLCRKCHNGAHVSSGSKRITPEQFKEKHLKVLRLYSVGEWPSREWLSKHVRYE
jgi:sarcosine oxidase delta subunit